MEVRTSTLDYFDVFSIDVSDVLRLFDLMENRGNQDGKTDSFEWSLTISLRDAEFEITESTEIEELWKDPRIPAVVTDFELTMDWIVKETSSMRRIKIESRGHNGRPHIWASGISDDEAWCRQVIVDLLRHLKPNRNPMYWMFRPAVEVAWIIMTPLLFFVSPVLGSAAESMNSPLLAYAAIVTASLSVVFLIVGALRKKIASTSSIQIKTHKDKRPNENLRARVILLIMLLTLVVTTLQFIFSFL